MKVKPATLGDISDVLDVFYFVLLRTIAPTIGLYICFESTTILGFSRKCYRLNMLSNCFVIMLAPSAAPFQHTVIGVSEKRKKVYKWFP
jgi:hypothetical protein